MVKNSYTQILDTLEKSLNPIDINSKEFHNQIENNLSQLKLHLNKLRKLVISQKFNSKYEEIEFFKNIKPFIVSKLISNLELWNISNEIPQSSLKEKIKFLEGKITSCQNYFNKNIEFYNYYKNGDNYLDKYYFTRSKKIVRIHPDSFQSLTDDFFNTTHDNTVAKMMGFEILIEYIQQTIQELKIEKENLKITTDKIASKLNWTGNKVDLVELIYALQRTNNINNGKADLKELVTIFETIFNTELKEYSRTFVEIRNRKYSNTKFLDLLKIALQKRIEEFDN